MKKLTLNQVILLHERLITLTGGATGLRDINLLDSALSSPFQTFDGQELYPTIIEKAAKMAFSIVNNHPFIDGNKRIGMLVMLTFLEINDVFLEYTDDDIIKMGLGLATGELSEKKLLNRLNNMEK